MLSLSDSDSADGLSCRDGDCTGRLSSCDDARAGR